MELLKTKKGSSDFQINLYRVVDHQYKKGGIKTVITYRVVTEDLYGDDFCGLYRIKTKREALKIFTKTN